MPNLAVGTLVRTTEGWNRNYHSEGVITQANDRGYVVTWPDGCVNNHANIFNLYKQPGESDDWEDVHFDGGSSPALLQVIGMKEPVWSLDNESTLSYDGVRVTITNKTVVININGNDITINR